MESGILRGLVRDSEMEKKCNQQYSICHCKSMNEMETMMVYGWGWRWKKGKWEILNTSNSNY